MAIYHFSVEAVSRSNGHSAVEKAAYLAGVCLVDQRTGLIHDYRVKAAGVLAHGHAGPVGWQLAEAAERRRDAKVARSIIIALPHELSFEQQCRLVGGLARYLRSRHGFAVEWAIHAAPVEDGGDARNVHAHLLLSARQVSDAGVIGAKTRELDRSSTARRHIDHWRRA